MCSKSTRLSPAAAAAAVQPPHRCSHWPPRQSTLLSQSHLGALNVHSLASRSHSQSVGTMSRVDVQIAPGAGAVSPQPNPHNLSLKARLLGVFTRSILRQQSKVIRVVFLFVLFSCVMLMRSRAFLIFSARLFRSSTCMCAADDSYSCALPFTCN